MTLRLAVPEDIGALTALIAASVRVLQAGDYTESQREGALASVFGVDTQLVADGTYFVAEIDGTIVACGGWSKRKTLFGADGCAGREDSLLDPAHDAAKIRAFFVDPAQARRGVGTLLLDRCETEARERGFSRVELMATLPGVRLYAARVYAGTQHVSYDLGNGEHIDFVPMSKQLR